jgi:hypothetical protein
LNRFIITISAAVFIGGAVTCHPFFSNVPAAAKRFACVICVLQFAIVTKNK